VLHLPRLFDDISTIGQGLREVANGANDILITVYAEWEDWDEAESEPWVAFDHSGRVVAAIATLADDTFIALQLVGELLLSASKDETHD